MSNPPVEMTKELSRRLIVRLCDAAGWNRCSRERSGAPTRQDQPILVGDGLQQPVPWTRRPLTTTPAVGGCDQKLGICGMDSFRAPPKP